ncbi:MAG: PIG-L family deacetylase [Thermoproteales archaeon]|nr:PIG-L family deacetylase [Thermoproteales archaeon]
MVKLMVVGAHAGDAEVTCGGLIAKYARAGHEVVIVHMTLGERGHPRLSEEEYGEQKRREAEEAARILGAKPVFLPYRDGELPASDEVKFRLCDLIREYRPEIVITHWRGSFHKDHRNTYEVVRDAIFYAALPAIKRERPAHSVRALYFAENWEDPFGFEPQVYVDISDAFEVWREAASAYAFARGETGFPYIEYYTCLFRIRGIESGFKYAQALMMPELQRRRRVEWLT